MVLLPAAAMRCKELGSVDVKKGRNDSQLDVKSDQKKESQKFRAQQSSPTPHKRCFDTSLTSGLWHGCEARGCHSLVNSQSSTTGELAKTAGSKSASPAQENQEN
jgi:hypothetical protein